MSSQYSRIEGVVVEQLDDGLCLFRPTDEEVLVLNDTAAAIWNLTDSPSDISRLCAEIAGSYDRGPDELRPDVERVLAELTEKGYLRTVDEPAAD